MHFFYQFMSALQSRKLFNIAVMLVMMVSLFPILIGKAFDKELACIVISVCISLVLHFSWGDIFEEDYGNGILEQFCVKASFKLVDLVIKRLLAHWAIYGVFLSVCAWVLSLMLGYQAIEGLSVFIAMLVLTFFMTFIGGLGSALMLSRRKISVLVPLIVIPLSIPILILSHLLMLGSNFYWKAMLLFMFLVSNIPLLVAAICKALRLAVVFG